MNVRRAVLVRFPDDLVDELDDAGLLVALGDFLVLADEQFERLSSSADLIKRFGADAVILFSAFSISALGASANCTGTRASKRTAFSMAVSNGLLTATCNAPLFTAVGSTEYWKATLVEILLRASAAMLNFGRSR